MLSCKQATLHVASHNTTVSVPTLVLEAEQPRIKEAGLHSEALLVTYSHSFTKNPWAKFSRTLSGMCCDSPAPLRHTVLPQI